MSKLVTKQIRGHLVSSSALSSYVGASDIKVGWDKLPHEFPSIIITQTGGGAYGYLGYKTSPGGSRIRRETVSMQLDIYSTKSRLETLQMEDIITPLLIVSSQARKESDIDTFDDELKAYRKILSYTITQFHDD